MGRLAKQVRVFDPETGEIVKDTVNYGGQNEEGFMLMYKDGILSLAAEAPSVALRTFLALASRQEYEGGIKVSKQTIANEIGMSSDSATRAFKWLKENKYVKEYKDDGITTFLLNPTVTTCGKKQLTEKKKRLWAELP